MLAIPKMNADLNVDLKNLINYLNNQNSSDELQKIHANDTEFLQQIRTAAVRVTEPSDLGQKQLQRYCYHLRQLIPRLGALETVTFTWSDAFSTYKRVTSNSFHFELACCLWNLGSFESYLGARVDRSSEDGIRIASKHFQQSAGYFEFIRENVLPHLRAVKSPCLSEESLQMVKQLMLAQAQLCFYEKAVKDKKKDTMKAGIIAKLAIQTSSFYHTAGISSKLGQMSSVLDNSWFSVSEFQCKCFQGAAEYWQAMASKEAALQRGSGFGEEVARLNRAETFVKQSLQLSQHNQIHANLCQGADALLQAIVNLRTNAARDLNSVYFENVAPESSLSEISGVVMVKAAGLPEYPALNEPTLFRDILHKQLLQMNMKFFDELTKLYSTATEQADTATNFARTTLSSVGLPGSLEATKSENPLPDPLWAKVQRIQSSMGGVNYLKTTFEDMKNAANRALLTMSNIDSALDREERLDENFRARYPDFFAVQSSVLTQDIRVNCNLMRDAYTNASKNDAELQSELFENKQTADEFSLLMKSREELLALFPSKQPVAAPINLLDFDEELDGPSNPSNASVSSKLEEQLMELTEIIEIRSKIVEDFKVIMNTDFIELTNRALVSNGSLPPAATNIAGWMEFPGVVNLHNEWINKCKELSEQVDSGVKKQEELLQEILKLNEEFVQSRTLDPVAIEKAKLIQQIEQSIAKYYQLHTQLSAGSTFYSNLQSKLTALQQSSDDLSFTQQWQRQEYETSKSRDLMRDSQEKQDHQLAILLTNEMNAVNVSAPNPLPPPTSEPVPFPYPMKTTAPVPNSNDIVYGTPVSGPPGNTKIIYSNVSNPPNTTNSFAPPSNPAVPMGNSNPVPQYPGMPQSQVQPNSSAPQMYYNSSVDMVGNNIPSTPYPQQSYTPVNIPINTYQALPTYQPQPNYQYNKPPDSTPVGYQTYSNVPQTQPYTSYVASPPTTYAPVQQQQSFNQPATVQPAQYLPPQPNDNEAKIMRICEMGFDREKVIVALNVNHWNEENALNSLLSEPNTTQAPSVRNTHVQAKPQAGLFGFWGKK